jgi:hypothetical protein
MKKILLIIRKWWNNPCFWSHDYELHVTEERGTVHKCKIKSCQHIKITTY